jgi:hypothetical protein
MKNRSYSGTGSTCSNAGEILAPGRRRGFCAGRGNLADRGEAGPKAVIMLRQGARVVLDSRVPRLVKLERGPLGMTGRPSN